MQSCLQGMEQGHVWNMLHGRPTTANHLLSGDHLHRVGLPARSFPHRASLERSNSNAHQSRLVFLDGTWTFVRSPFVPLIISVPTDIILVRTVLQPAA